jgi:D-sedoheptulose 7-phosphate isomerase
MGEPSRRTPAEVLAGARSRRSEAGAAFLNQADALTRACRAMAGRFAGGGRLVVWGTGVSEADARHVAVEFVHPVIVGKHALPALAVSDVAQVGVVARPGDIVMLIASDAGTGDADSVERAASRAGALTVALLGEGHGTDGGGAQHVIRAPDADPRVVRELQVTAYHVLWELVHVFLEGSSLVGSASCPACADEAVIAAVVDLLPDDMARVVTPTGTEEISVALVDVGVGDRVVVHAAEAIGLAREGVPPEGLDAVAARDESDGLASLYPFLYGHPSDASTVDVYVRESTEQKMREIAGLRDEMLADESAALLACAAALARAFDAGATLFAFGNGGSSTDALALCRLFLAPTPDGRPGLPAVCLPDDAATVTALANDVSFDVVYARQLAALATSRDIAFGISTSGGSENVNRALLDARSRDLEIVGLAGGTGGNMMTVGSDHAFVVRSSSVHRVQEAQTTLYQVLWELTRAALR